MLVVEGRPRSPALARRCRPSGAGPEHGRQG